MDHYVELADYSKYMGIKKGDIVFISSDAKLMLFDALSHHKSLDLNQFIEGLIDAVGEDGTIIFPTYNWGFCRGETFNYYDTPCETGVLGKVALKRNDFKRTKHPIYSFAVYGKYQKKLCDMNNTDSFGMDSPFGFFYEKNVDNYIIDVSLNRSFTFSIFAEQHSNAVPYRYLKNFTADYIDEDGKTEKRTYSMFVRDLDMDVVNDIDPIQQDFVKMGAERDFIINSSTIKHIKLRDSYPIMINDILYNDSRKLCKYKGQTK